MHSCALSLFFWGIFHPGFQPSAVNIKRPAVYLRTLDVTELVFRAKGRLDFKGIGKKIKKRCRDFYKFEANSETVN